MSVIQLPLQAQNVAFRTKQDLVRFSLDDNRYSLTAVYSVPGRKHSHCRKTRLKCTSVRFRLSNSEYIELYSQLIYPGLVTYQNAVNQ